jgi:hypothetical protein
MEREVNMKKKIKKFAEGGYQGREGQKALNLDELSSLNLETGIQTPKEWLNNPRLYGVYDQMGAMGDLFQRFGFGKETLSEDLLQKFPVPFAKKMKKGGKVKAKRKPIDGIAKSGKTRAKHRKDR